MVHVSVCCRRWSREDAERLVDQEEELCYLVVNILFMILWRGVEGANKEAWKVSVSIQRMVLTLLWCHERSYVNSTMGSY
jgi:hypothetical protein